MPGHQRLQDHTHQCTPCYYIHTVYTYFKCGTVLQSLVERRESCYNQKTTHLNPACACNIHANIRVLSFSFIMESSEVASKLADSAAGRGSGKGAVVLLATLRGGAGILNGSLLVRPLLDLVTLVGVAATVVLAAGRGGSFPDDFRLPCTTPPLQVCLRDVAVGGVKGGVAPPVPMGVGGREMEYDL